MHPGSPNKLAFATRLIHQQDMQYKVFAFALFFLALPAHANEDWPAKAIALMVDKGKDIRPSHEYLVRFDNEFQYAALEALLSNPNYEIANKAESLLNFQNPHQVHALRAMVEHDYSVTPIA